MRQTITSILCCVYLLAGPEPVLAQPVLSFTSEASGLTEPVDIAYPPDGSGRLFIVEQTGAIRIYSGGVLQPGNFLDVSGSINSGGEQGLLSLAFHPDYATNGYFFVLYTNTDDDPTLARFQVSGSDPDLADSTTGVVLLSVPHPVNTNHNGGKLIFGTDGYLYWSTGDGGGGGDVPNNAQNGSSLLGKMLRLDVDAFAIAPYYTIPPSNPFVSDPTVLDEIYSLGLRNPWRWSFDRLTGDMWLGDVGQGSWEEVDFVSNASGLNFGWRCREGAHDYNTTGCSSSYTEPVYEYPHDMATGGFALTGGYVYRGALYPSIYGKYVMADYISGNAWILTPSGGSVTGAIQTTGLPSNISGFGEDAVGELYALNRAAGVLYSVSASTPLPLQLLSFGSSRNYGCYQLKWKAIEEEADRYEIWRSEDGNNYELSGSVTALNTAGTNSYTYPLCNLPSQEGFYKLQMIHRNGNKSWSPVINIRQAADASLIIYPTTINNGRLNIQSGQTLQSVEFMDATGNLVFRQELNSSGYMAIDLPSLSPGSYYARLVLDDGSTVVKRFVLQ